MDDQQKIKDLAENINDLVKHIKSMKNQMDALHEYDEKLNARLHANDMVIRALVTTHPNRAAFESVFRAGHESYLANAIPSEWSDSQIELVSKKAMGLLRP